MLGLKVQRFGFGELCQDFGFVALGVSGYTQSIRLRVHIFGGRGFFELWSSRLQLALYLTSS